MNDSERKIFKVGYVAIVGRPNVGKSTLLNNLLNFKISSVTRKPQTTRHQIRGILNEKDYQIIFLDTPGLLTQTQYKLHEAMQQAAYRSVKDADSVLFMISAKSGPDDLDVKKLQGILQLNHAVILAINKIDLITKDLILPTIDFYQRFEKLKTIVPISALKREGLDVLKQELVDLLPEGPPFYDTEQITDHPERFLVSEIVREKIFQRYGDEIPYATTVEVDEFKERNKSKDFIKATIYIERESQKGILIGKKGAALKELGKVARKEIEQVLGRSVFLELWVKVKEKWRQKERELKNFGYYN